MSCLPAPVTFRLLDGWIGWDAVDHTGLTGLDDPAGGVVLAQLDPAAIDPGLLDGLLPPASLARGCGSCGWYLATPAPPPSRLLRLRCATGDRRDAAPAGCTLGWIPATRCGEPGDALVAVAAHRHLVAASDAAGQRVLVLAASGEEPLAAFPVAEPGPLVFTPAGLLLVISGGAAPRLLAFSPAGDALDALPPTPAAPAPSGCPAPMPIPALPAGAQVERLAADATGGTWMATRAAGGRLHLWHAAPGQAAFRRASLGGLAQAFRPTGLATAPAGFRLRDPQGADAPACSFDWYGRPLAPGVVPAGPALPRARRGQLLTLPLDSGIPRCRWHRVRIEADVPAGTGIEVDVATAEDPGATAQGVAAEEGDWQAFPPGAPNPADWQRMAGGQLDFLVDQPPGRYLRLRLRLSGDGTASPAVRRIRLDLPRSTSLELLPPVYREDPAAEDFTERFLSLFDAEVAALDEAVSRFPALLDAGGVPPEVLPWLASFLDIVLDPSWSVAQRRAILAAAPGLYRRRGTRAGLSQAIELVLGVAPALEELAPLRPWRALGRDSRLGATVLFAPSRARFTLGASELSRAPLRSLGDPALDPLAAPAWRFRVQVPALPGDAAAARRRLEALVEAQKPAHTAASVRVGGGGLLVGAASAVGVDTAVTHLPAPVLGRAGNVRLSRRTVLWPRRGGAPGRLSIGRTSAVGLSTVSA
jgi:phage tail-like protein